MKKDRVQRTKTGRRTTLTPAVQQTIVNAITVGMPFAHACQLAGVSANVAGEWRRRGEGADPDRPCTPLYATFATAIAHARAQDIARRVARIDQAAQGGAVLYERTVEKLNKAGEVVARITEVQYAAPDWRADAFHLERAYPDQWGRRERLDVTHTERMIREKAQRLADELGMPVEEVLAEAERYARGEG